MDPTREQRLTRIVASLRHGDVVTYRDAYGEMTGTVSLVGDRMLYVWATKDVIRGYDGKPDEGLVDILAVTRDAAELDLDAFGLTSGCGTTRNERRDDVSAYIVDGELWESPAPPLEVVQPMKMERLTAGGFTGTGAPSPFYPGEEKWLIAESAVPGD